MNKIKIPIFRLHFDILFKIKFFLKSWDILSSGRPLGESKYVDEFEKKFKKVVGSRYSVACSNGTTALELALKSLDVQGKEVLIPSNTFFATSVSVENAGGILTLLDMDGDSFSIDVNDLKNKIHRNVGAVILVHIGGIISDKIKEIVEICKDNGVPLVEDAAHAHGSYLDHYIAGSIGEVSCFSFFPTKVMTTGEGGMITTNNEKIFLKLKSLKNFGRDNNDNKLIVNHYGNNFKTNEFVGLMGSLECDRFLKRIDTRKKLIEKYEEELMSTNFKVLKQNHGRCSYYKCILISPYNPIKIKKFLFDNGIVSTGEVYNIPIHMQPLYRERFQTTNLPNTDFYSQKHICPPLYPELKSSEVEYICDILKKFENYEKQSS